MNCEAVSSWLARIIGATALLAALLGAFSGCGQVTPAAELAPPGRGAADGGGGEVDPPGGGPLDGAAEPVSEVGTTPAVVSAPPEPLHDAGLDVVGPPPGGSACLDQLNQLRTVECSPGCGTCVRLHEPTEVDACWAGGFHCVHSCGDC
jgi:hypothetical protein